MPMPSGLPRTGWSRRRRSLADARRRGWRSRCCARSWRSAAMADAYLEDYREQGFAVVRGVFALAEMREMAEAFDRVYAPGMAHRASFREKNVLFRQTRAENLGRNLRPVQWPPYFRPVLSRHPPRTQC